MSKRVMKMVTSRLRVALDDGEEQLVWVLHRSLIRQAPFWAWETWTLTGDGQEFALIRRERRDGDIFSKWYIVLPLEPVGDKEAIPEPLTHIAPLMNNRYSTAEKAMRSLEDHIYTFYKYFRYA